MKKTAFSELIYKNASYLVVALISLAYIASSLLLISKTGRSVYEILGAGLLSLIVGSLINSAFRSAGVRKGEADERTQSTAILHATAVEEIVPFIDRLDTFCEEENARVLKRVRTSILAGAGLKYEDCFDENGLAMGLKGDLGADNTKNKQRERAYRKACKIKPKPLSSFLLTSDGVDYANPYDFGKSKRDFAKSKSLTDVAGRVIMAVIFGYFGVTLSAEINVATLIWNTLQIVMYVTGGVIGMYSSFMYVVDEHRLGIIKKIDILQKFKLYVDKESLR